MIGSDYKTETNFYNEFDLGAPKSALHMNNTKQSVDFTDDDPNTPTSLTLPSLVKFYLARDGFVVRWKDVLIFSVAIVIFTGLCIFAIINMVKFYRHRSYALGLFYIFTIVNLILRALYFVSCFFTETSYYNVVFMCSPAAFSCAIGLC